MTFLGGFAAGVIIGVLFTPAKGEDTRELVDHSMRKLAHEFKEKADEQVTHLKSIGDRFIYAIKSKIIGQKEIEEMVDVHAWI